MAAGDIQKGDTLVCYVDGVIYEAQLDCTFEVNVDMLETTHKTSGGWKDYEGGDGGWTITSNGRFKYSDSGETVKQMFSDIKAKAKGTFKVVNSVEDKAWGGNGLVQTFSMSGPRNDIATYDISIMGCNEPQETDVAS